MPKITNFYTISPDEIKPGMVFVATITAHVGYDGSIRCYRCSYPDPQTSNGIPQGGQIDSKVALEIFPVLKWAIEGNDD